jgi:putative transposase
MYVPEKRPIIVSGKPIVYINNKFKYKLSRLQSKLTKQNSDPVMKECLLEKYRKTWIKREHTINDMFHKISTKIIQVCKKAKIKELIIGYNTNWKQNVNMGKKNNFNFGYIPYKRLLSQLFYKGEERNISIIEIDESYTSICDAFGLEEIRRHDTYIGKRTKRGLFVSQNGTKLNSDVNGAINIMRKHINHKWSELNETINVGKAAL